MRLFIYMIIGLAMMPHVANAWRWALPAKVDGVLFIDHFGGCYFYNDIALMYVSDKNRALVAPHTNKLVSLNVTGIYQVTIPGDIRLDHFTIDDPAEDSTSNRNQLQLDASLQTDNKGSSIKLSVTNRGDKTFSIYPGIIDFFVLTKSLPKKDKFLDVSDGPTTPLGRERISGEPQRSWMGTYSNDQARLKWAVRGGHEIQDKVDLLPGQSINIVIDFEYAKGQYELLFGYKVLRDSSYETAMGINDLVLPVISNSIVLNANYFQPSFWLIWILAVCAFAFLVFRIVQRFREKTIRA